jgi:hypothetical protein
LAVFVFAAAADGGGAEPSSAAGSHPKLVPAAGGDRCVVLLRQPGGDVLVNRCGSCRTVKVSRTRPTDDPPLLRDFTLIGNGRLPLSFKGPGNTRVTSEMPCEGTPGASPNLLKPGPTLAEQTAIQCVRPVQTESQGLVLVNSCGACRSVVVERRGARGEVSHKTYSVGSRSFVPLPAEGAESGQLVKEGDCS